MPTNDQILKAATELAKIKVEEVSGVDEPANLTPGWLLAKSASGAPAPLQSQQLPEAAVTLAGHGSSRFAVYDVETRRDHLVKAAASEQALRQSISATQQGILDFTGRRTGLAKHLAAQELEQRRHAVREQLAKSAARVGREIPVSNAQIDAVIARADRQRPAKARWS